MPLGHYLDRVSSFKFLPYLVLGCEPMHGGRDAKKSVVVCHVHNQLLINVENKIKDSIATTFERDFIE